MTTLVSMNSSEAIQSRLDQGRIPRYGPMLMLVARSAFILLAQGITFQLNGVIGLIAGQRYMKDRLVAAAGVHFWTDMVFHVMWGLF